MILEFTVKNFKSFHKEAKFSMSAETTKLKSNNIHTIINSKDQKFRVSKASVIYGANASGKSNLIKAMGMLVDYIVTKPNVGNRIKIYSPFFFDLSSYGKSTSYELIFLGPDNIKYDYKIKVSSQAVLEESLDYYPQGRRNNLYRRASDSDSAEAVEEFTVGSKNYPIFSNQSLLSKFGEEPHPILSNVYLYFKNRFNVNITTLTRNASQRNEISRLLLDEPKLKDSLTQLLRVVDTKIGGIHIENRNTTEQDDEKIDNMVRNIMERQGPLISYEHDLYDGDNKIEAGIARLSFEHESRGSQTLFTLGTNILKSIEKGQIIIVDELDSSLHPFVTKLLVMLFLSSKINKNGAQLIFNTHDVTLLDEDLFRKDQIWFVEKNEKGESDLYSLNDFDGLREDTPFEKWYMAGKFGGLPNIDSIESIFDNEPAD